MENLDRKILEKLAEQGGAVLSSIEKKLRLNIEAGRPKSAQDLSTRLRNLLSFSAYLTSQVKMPPRKGVQIAEDTLCASRFSARTIYDFACPDRLQQSDPMQGSEKFISTLDKFIKKRDSLFLHDSDAADEYERAEARLKLNAHFYQFFRCWQRSQTAVKAHREKQRELIHGTSDALNMLKAMSTPMSQMQFLYELCLEEAAHYKADRENGVLGEAEGQYVEPIFEFATYLHFLAPPRSCFYFHIDDLVNYAKVQDWAVKELQEFNTKRVALSNSVLEAIITNPDFVQVMEDGFRWSDPNADQEPAQNTGTEEDEEDDSQEPYGETETNETNEANEANGEMTLEEKKRRLLSGFGMRFASTSQK